MSRRTGTLHERVVERGEFKYIQLKSGRFITFWDAIRSAERGHTAFTRAVSRALKLADSYDLERLEWLMENMQTYANHVLKLIEERRGVHSQEERIALLRNVQGRTPAEAAAFNSKADQLERRLRRESK